MTEFKGTFRAPTEEDIEFLASHMRPADRRELKRWTAQEPEYELRHSISLSEKCYAGVFPNGEVGSIFGACRANLLDKTAVIWSLSSDAVDKYPIEFCRGTRSGVDMLMRSMPDIEEFSNFVDMDYKAAVRWIEWFGGTFSIDPKIRGLRGGEFGQFYIANPYYKED